MRWILALAVVAIAAPASAHQSAVKVVDLQLDGRHVDIAITLAPGDVTEPLLLPVDARPPATTAATPAVALYVSEWLTIADCEPDPPEAHADGNFVVVQWRTICMADPVGDLELDFTRFFDIDLRHEAAVSVHLPGERGEPTIVRAKEPIVVVHAIEPSISDWLVAGAARSYGAALFVIALIALVVIDRRNVVAAARVAIPELATFTTASLLACTAGAVGWISLPAHVVVAFAAVSVIAIAAANVIVPAANRRAAVVVSGLVHGFALATAIHQRPPITAIAAFALGVVGVFALVAAIVLPVTWVASRSRHYRRYVLPAISVVVSVAAIKWLIVGAFDM